MSGVMGFALFLVGALGGAAACAVIVAGGNAERDAERDAAVRRERNAALQLDRQRVQLISALVPARIDIAEARQALHVVELHLLELEQKNGLRP